MIDVISSNTVASDLSFLKGVPYTLTAPLTRLFESGSDEIAVMLAEVGRRLSSLPSVLDGVSGATLEAANNTREQVEKEVKARMNALTVSYSGELGPPFYLTYVGEKLTLLTGSSATAWLDSISLDIDAYIKPPTLVITSADYVPYESLKHLVFTEVQFAASFRTEVGESSLSNIESILAAGAMWYSVNLDVTPESVPDLAVAVRYYRMFNGVFRLVGEVAL